MEQGPQGKQAGGGKEPGGEQGPQGKQAWGGKEPGGNKDHKVNPVKISIAFLNIDMSIDRLKEYNMYPSFYGNFWFKMIVTVTLTVTVTVKSSG